MARALCCDRCGEFFKGNEMTYTRKYRIIDRTIKGHAMMDGDFVDICDKCYEKLEQFMEGNDVLLPEQVVKFKCNPNGTMERLEKED